MSSFIKKISYLSIVSALVIGFGAMTAAANDGSFKRNVENKADRAANYIDDASTTASVKADILREMGVSSHNVSVDTNGNVVTLTGTVENEAQRTRVINAAKNSNGVTRVVDNLRVDRDGDRNYNRNLDRNDRDYNRNDRSSNMNDRTDHNNFIEDAAITASVKTKLIGTKGVSAMDINVDTDDGVVTLNGAVDNSAQIRLAEDVAREADGVRRVNNRLVVK